MKGFFMTFYTRYNPSSDRSDYKSVQKSQTQQHFQLQSDINWIIAHYQEIPQRALDAVSGPRQPLWGDFSAVPDLRTAQAMLSQAEASFMALPSELRARFGNDPLQLLAFVQDSSNRDEAIKLGLIDKAVTPVDPVPAAAPVSAVNAETLSQS